MRLVFAAAACLLSVNATLWAQDSDAPTPSLGDLARQSRAQHSSADQSKSTSAQELVDEMQREQEEAGNAPVGFTSFDAGDYRVLVPNPSTLEGRENGAVLAGSRVGVTNTEVLAGTPIPIPPNLSDIAVRNLVSQVAGLHGQSPYCSPVTLGTHKAFRCYWNGAPRLLGHEVWGTMDVIVASNSLIPIMCVSPDELRQCLGYDRFGYHTCGNRNPTWSEVQQTKDAINTRFHDELTTGQMCDQIIYPSIRLKEDIVVHPATLAETKPAKAATPAPAEDKMVVAVGSPTTSLADLARRTRQAAHPVAQATVDNAEGGLVPEGFQSFAVIYCANPQQCSQATVVIPAQVEVVSKVNGQYIFKAAQDGNPVFLYAGPADVNAPYRSLTDPDYIRMRDLANANEWWSRGKVNGVSTQEVAVDGHAAVITRFGYEREPKKSWIGERVLIDNYGQQFLLGCTAPEETFADAEALCTTLVNSLRLE